LVLNTKNYGVENIDIVTTFRNLIRNCCYANSELYP
jgi:hypothetical protein